MRIWNSAIALIASLLFAGSAGAVVITTPSQTGLVQPLTFTLSPVTPAVGNATFSIFASGDLGINADEFLTISIGPTGGSLTSFGTYFDTSSGFELFGCNSGLACIRGTVDIVVDAATFNSFGSSIDVRLVPGPGVDDALKEGSANVKLTYTEASTVPEPTTLALLGLGLAGVPFARRRVRVR